MNANEMLLTVLAEEGSKWLHQALKIVGREDAAQEVLQQCACQLGQVRRAALAPEAIRPYIARTVRNTALAFRAAQWRAHVRQEALPDAPARAWADPGSSPLDVLLHAERDAMRTALRERVRQGLSALPPEQQRAVRWMYLCLKPMTLASLAEAEGVSLWTARRRVQKGLHTLRRYVAPAGLAAGSAPPSAPAHPSPGPPTS